MSSRGSHRMSVARHVYLRTQQHRLRHVKSVVIRNLTLTEVNSDLLNDPLAMETHFTLHSIHYPEKVVYKSYPVRESYNPSWESVQFNPQDYEKYAAVAVFILKLWVKVGKSNQMMLAFEKTIDLPSLVYLGTLVNKDGSSYPPNSVIVGMYEGYYSHPGVGGVLSPPKITHALEKLLPPQSLLEVHKLEVQDSYFHPILQRLLSHQEAHNEASTASKQAHNQVETLMSVEEAYFQKRSEREMLKMRLAILKSQLTEKEKEETEERNQLCKLQDELDTKELMLSVGLTDLEQQKEKYAMDYEEYCRKREMLFRAKRNQLLRQRNMICEAAHTFFITERRDKFTICNVILQNSDQLDQPSSIEQPGVALGYVAHLVHHLAKILLVPLQYEVRPNGSRSHICDYISDEAIIDDIREFPLFLKGSERALFHYAVHLLNKDIAQVRQHCGYGVSKSMQKKTLPNLKFLLDKIIKELSSQPNTPSRLNSSSVSLQSNSPTSVTVSPMAVPQGGIRKMRKRSGASSTTSPSTDFTPPQSSLSTETDVYSSSVSSSMAFQPFEDGGGSRSMSPLPLQSSQDDTSIESSEQSFPSSFQFPESTGPVSSPSTVQQYPIMQSDMQGRYYPMLATQKAHGSLFPVLSPVPSINEDIASSPGSQEKVSFHQVTPEQSPSPKSQNAITSQSFAHADLHRSKLPLPAEPIEEMTSVGMRMNTCSEREDTSALTHIHSNTSVAGSRPPAGLESCNEFVIGTDNILGSTLEHSPQNSVGEMVKNEDANSLPNKGDGVQNGDSRTLPTERNVSITLKNNSTSLSDSHTSNNHQQLTDNQDPSQIDRTNHNAVVPTADSFSVSTVETSSRRVDSASFQHTLIETGYIKTVLATPHKVLGSGGDTGNRETSIVTPKYSSNKNSDGLNDAGGESGVDGQTELLEDFIDGF